MFRHLLYVDGFAGALAGTFVVLTYGWLSEWYGIDRSQLMLMGIMNLVYASYSLTLATRRRRQVSLIVLLATANMIWSIACFRWSLVYAGTATILGQAHLLGEGLFVGVLAILEYRWRYSLSTSEKSSSG